MMDISINQQNVQINHLGFIESYSFDPLITPEFPIYLVFFKEHSHLDPTCRQLDVSTPVTNLQCQSETQLSYDKSIEGIT